MEWVKTIGNGFGTADLVLLCVAVLLAVLLCIRHGRPALKKLTARDDIPGYALLYADRKQDKNKDFGRLLYTICRADPIMSFAVGFWGVSFPWS